MVADTENLADLVITFAAVDTPALAAFTEMSAAGEEMVASVTTAATETTAALTEMQTSAEEAATAMTTAMTEASAPLAEVGAAAQKTAADVAEANARMAEVEKEWAAATDQAAAEVAAANERQAASFAALKDKVEADNAKMAAATKEAAAANDTLAAVSVPASTAAMATLSGAAGKGAAAYSGFAAKIGMTGTQLTLLGGVAAAVAVSTTKMAGDFESETQRLVSSAGEAQSQLDYVRQKMLDVSSQTGYSAKDLADAMYKIESGGQHAKMGIETLQAAAEGARAENANLETVADAVTSAMTDYGRSAGNAATVTSKLVAATGQGKMTFEELARSLASVLPVASANHVGLDDILGDMASMTTHGMSAQRTTQNLADTIKHMAGPLPGQAKAMALIGVSAIDVSSKLGQRGLSGTVEMLSQKILDRMGPSGQVVLKMADALNGLDPQVQALGQQLMNGSISMSSYTKAANELPPLLQGQASQFATLAKSTHGLGTAQKTGAEIAQSYSGQLRQVMGDATGMNVALMLTGANTQTTNRAIKAVSGATTEAGNHVAGWAGIQGTFNQKMKEAHASMSALAIEVGQVFLPVASKLLGWFATGAKFFAQHRSLAIALAVVVGGVLVLAITGMVVAMYAFASSLVAVEVAGAPLWLIILAIIAAVAILAGLAYLIVHNWGHIKAFFVGLWHDVEDAFKAAWNGIKSAFNGVVHFFESMGKKIAEPFVKGWHMIKSLFEMSPKEIGEKVGEAIGAYVRWVAHFWTSLWHDAVAAFHAVVNAAKAFGKDVVAGAKAAITWLMDTPKKIRDLFKDAGKWLVKAAKDMWSAYLRYSKAGWALIWDWIKDSPTHIKDLFKDAGKWLEHTGKDLWNGLVKGLKDAWHSVTSALSGFVKGFIDGFKKGLGINSPSTVFLDFGKNIFEGLLNGLKNAWTNLNNWFGGIPQKIMNFFLGGAQWLVNAGQAILEGFLNGLKNAWGDVTSFVGGIGDWISKHKGPVEVDRQLLVPHGNAIMRGLHEGLTAGNQLVQAFVTSVPQQITAKLSGAADGAHAAGQSYAEKLAAGIRGSQHLAVKAAQDMADGVNGAAVQVKPGSLAGGYGGYGYAGSLAASGAAVGGDTHVHLNVAVNGSVWTTKNLVTELQQELTRVGMRNTTNGTNYLGFNRGTTARP